MQGAAFVGRLTKQAVAEKACDLLQCPRAYAPVIQALSPKRRADTHGDHELPSEALDTGEFVFLDPLGRIGKIRIDIDWHPGLREALNTTPGRHGCRPGGRPADAVPRPGAVHLDPAHPAGRGGGVIALRRDARRSLAKAPSRADVDGARAAPGGVGCWCCSGCC